uniref:Uncharacterized protein n=1 Tax=viral metagenome TaxID=1070528 RepID=A0A6C0ITW3_9ZZZZ
MEVCTYCDLNNLYIYGIISIIVSIVVYFFINNNKNDNNDAKTNTNEESCSESMCRL